MPVMATEILDKEFQKYSDFKWTFSRHVLLVSTYEARYLFLAGSRKNVWELSEAHQNET